MGAITGMLGIGGNGADFKAQGTNILQPSTVAQANDAYSQSQQGIAQQQAFLQALQGQNGIGNQSQVYNQLQGVVNGTGPNPAQAMLANATGANTANQAALMAGQRGAGANVGLIGRNIAQQAAANQQQQAGQAAALQAQQSLNALGQAGSMAGQQVGQQAGALQNLNQFQQGEQGQILGGIAGQNNANVAMQSNINNANAGVAAQNAKGSGGILGGLVGGLGSALTSGLGGMFGGGGAEMGGGEVIGPAASQSSFPNVGPLAPGNGAYQQAAGPGFDRGGMVGCYDEGGPVSKPTADTFAKGMGMGFSPDEPQSLVGRFLNGLHLGEAPQPVPTPAPMQPTMSKGGEVPARVSPGEGYIPPGKVKQAAKDADPRKDAKKVPGKAKVKGDDIKNDTVHAKLEAGGIVLPRTDMESAHKAAQFIQAVLAKKGLG